MSFKISHLDIVATAQPVPVEVAAAAHADQLRNADLIWTALRKFNLGELEPHGKLSEAEKIKTIAENFVVTAKPSEKEAHVTEVELRYRCDNRFDCVAIPKAITGAYSSMLLTPDPKLDERFRDLERICTDLESQIELRRRASDIKGMDKLAEQLRRLKLVADHIRLRKRVGWFLITPTLMTAKVVIILPK
jgi:hypothetical protein